jgi:hypothetical protein
VVGHLSLIIEVGDDAPRQPARSVINYRT